MKFITLQKTDRRTVAEGIIAWGNLVFAGLVLGQSGLFTTNIPWSIAISGILFWLSAYLLAVLILIKGGDRL